MLSCKPQIWPYHIEKNFFVRAIAAHQRDSASCFSEDSFIFGNSDCIIPIAWLQIKCRKKLFFGRDCLTRAIAASGV